MGGKGFHTFQKGISPKVNVIEWKWFELVYFMATVRHFTHHATETHSLMVSSIDIKYK